MGNQPDYLSDFAAKIDPYLDCWRSLDFACIACRVGHEWVQVAGRATLSTRPLQSESISKPIVDLEDFRAYKGHLAPKEIHNLIANLKASTIHSGFGDDTDAVRLLPSGSQRYSWWQPFAHRWPSGDTSPKDWPSVWSIHGSGHFQVPNAWPDIDTRLRLHAPPYNGLGGLCATLGLQYDASANAQHFNLYADLPARFLAGAVDRKAKNLRLTMEYVGTPDLVVEWMPSHATQREPVPAGNPQIPGQHELAISIPSGAMVVKANLLTMASDADTICVRMGWENILLRICEFFDPGQSKLEDFLFKGSNLKNASPFELGVARLLGLAGYNVLWFGKGVKEALPDIVAYVREPLGPERIIYGECTLKNPTEKFSDLATRADDLRKNLGLQDGAILPVVFIRSNTTSHEHQTAREHGVVLCDREGIQQLQEKIKSDATPNDVFQFLRAQGSGAVIQNLNTSNF